MLDNQPNYNSNRSLQPTVRITTTPNTNGFIAPFYSIKLKDFNKVFNTDLRSLHHARAHTVILFHLSKYSRCLQTSMSNTYGLSSRLTLKVLTLLVENGSITTIPTKRKTYLGLFVPLISYSITPAGKDIVNRLNDLLNEKVAKLSK